MCLIEAEYLTLALDVLLYRLLFRIFDNLRRRMKYLLKKFLVDVGLVLLMLLTLFAGITLVSVLLESTLITIYPITLLISALGASMGLILGLWVNLGKIVKITEESGVSFEDAAYMLLKAEYPFPKDWRDFKKDEFLQQLLKAKK